MVDTANTESSSLIERGRLLARELPSSINTPELLKEHAIITNGKVRTRFPPEPNGYLHVGHAKSMNMNFDLAFEKLGVPAENRQTIFRYDDTNPEAESNEYIESLREDVEWLGWKPNPVTFTSDYFDILYELAIKLIKKGKAYVCHQTKAEIEACREIAKARIAGTSTESPCSPWRDRLIEESLREFENMRKGKYGASEATLRMKMDMFSPNPNMWDQVAYRVKFVPHPHAGDKWCIYPTYDYTHCIIDSLEHIDYSICTLEFESRRESYYWVLEALEMYRPKVYEMSRLNISYTVLSKRKLLKLVTNGFMRGWDDPRMPTIKGLKRRGYTPAILNAFCRDIGVTRNYNVVQYDRLAATARSILHETAPRVMAVLSPLKVVIDGIPTSMRSCEALNYPFDATRGSHPVPMEDTIYIDKSDFRIIDREDYYGLAPGKMVGLKYAFKIRCDEVEKDSNDEPILLRCSVIMDTDVKVKGNIHWVPASTAVSAEVRMYGHLFTVEEPSDDDWEKELNPDSEIVHNTALIDPSIITYYHLSHPTNPDTHFQFERVGFFVIDKDSVILSKANDVTDVGSVMASTMVPKLVFNLTVSLKDSKPIAVVASSGNTGNSVATGASRSRKEEQMKALADKMARKSIPPQEMYKSQTDLYSQFDEDGIPTHDAKGEKLSKNAMKNLRKDWEKQKRLYEST